MNPFGLTEIDWWPIIWRAALAVGLGVAAWDIAKGILKWVGRQMLKADAKDLEELEKERGGK